MLRKLLATVAIGVLCLSTSAQKMKQAPKQKEQTIDLSTALKKHKSPQEGSKLNLTRGGVKFAADVSKGKFVNWQATDSKGEVHTLVFANQCTARPDLRLCCAKTKLPDPRHPGHLIDTIVNAPCAAIQ
jgi:hypothetical protein